VGGHTYHTPYQGPIGSVITPQFRGIKEWGHLSFASSLCAACSSVCPVDINIHELLLENRWESYQKEETGSAWGLGLKIWAWIMSSRSRLDFANKLARRTYRILSFGLSPGKRKRIPDLPSQTFGKLWKQYEQQT
jgi:L-lactate dehydrogenase complex protein LldF